MQMCVKEFQSCCANGWKNEEDVGRKKKYAENKTKYKNMMTILSQLQVQQWPFFIGSPPPKKKPDCIVQFSLRSL